MSGLAQLPSSPDARQDTRQDPAARREAKRRLVMLGALVAVAFAAVRWGGLDVSPERLRQWGADFGPLAPVLFVCVGVALTSVLVPYPLIVGAAGLVMGIAVGIAVGLVIVALASVTQMCLTRSVLRDTAQSLLSGRARTSAAMLEDGGPWGVFWVRLLPGLPFAPLNYAAGLTRLRLRYVALGTTLALAPRVFAYTALGGTLGNLGEPETRVALLLLIATVAVGAVVARQRLKGGWSAARFGGDE